MKKNRQIGALILLTLALALLLATTAFASAYITPESATEAALAHAGVAAADADIVRVKLDTDRGVVEYEVEFYAGNTEYDYDINAETGAVISFDSELESMAKKPGSDAKNLITEEQAKAIAYESAKVAPADATLILAQLDYDDGRWEYEIEFYHGTMGYDYTLNAQTGEIVSFDQETDHRFNPALVTSNTAPAGSAVTADQAKAIALAHAGFQEANVQKLKVKSERDDGMTKFEVEFKVDRMEYSYEINAADGSILDFEKDDD